MDLLGVRKEQTQAKKAMMLQCLGLRHGIPLTGQGGMQNGRVRVRVRVVSTLQLNIEQRHVTNLRFRARFVDDNPPLTRFNGVCEEGLLFLLGVFIAHFVSLQEKASMINPRTTWCRPAPYHHSALT